MTRVNKDIVLDTINELIAQGVEITTLNVHKITGGSLTTVSKYIKEIRAEQARKNITPDFLRKKINHIADEIYNTLNDSFNSKRQELEQAQEQFTKEKAKIQAELETLNQDNAELKKQLNELKVKLQTTQTIMQEQRLDFVAELSKKDTDLKMLNDEVVRLKDLIEKERADFKQVLANKMQEIAQLVKI